MLDGVMSSQERESSSRDIRSGGVLEQDCMSVELLADQANCCQSAGLSLTPASRIVYVVYAVSSGGRDGSLLDAEASQICETEFDDAVISGHGRLR